MPRLLAEDLLLLCWDTRTGKAHRACTEGLTPGLGGALVLDALRADALTVHDGRAAPSDNPPEDPLLRDVIAEASRGRRDPTVKTMVQRVGTSKRRQQIIHRLIDAGVLRLDRRRVLGLIPLTCHQFADPATPAALTATVRQLLTGARTPEDAETHHLLLAVLTAPTGAIDVLVDRPQRKQARQRAEAFTRGHGIPAAVGQAIVETQTAIAAAVVAVVVNQSSTSSNTNS